MSRKIAFALLMTRLAFGQFPQAEISNSQIRAKLYLPDPQAGYYRATRFDWSGVISSLEWNGHTYFGQWFNRYDPNLHDSITGPVEEFLTNASGLGYDEAKPGDSFVKIGVGALRRPDDAPFRQFNTYEITNPGKGKRAWNSCARHSIIIPRISGSPFFWATGSPPRATRT
jgi:hypothetical protein